MAEAEGDPDRGGPGRPLVGVGVGVDGCRAGWLAIRLGAEGGWEASVFASVADLLAAWDDPDGLILIDVPVGLPDTTSFRACDAEARRYLGRRSSSVFNPPTRSALAAGSYREASDRNEAACGKRLSRQTWFVMPRIAEVDRLLREAPRLQERIREAHPETLFQALNGDEPLAHRKKAFPGVHERLALLRPRLPRAREIFEALRERYRRREVALDDILDALVAAVVASRFRDSLRTFPEHPDRDSAGLIREMVLPGPPSTPSSPPRSGVTTAG
jgi:predicted RNase H-like nuclease